MNNSLHINDEKLKRFGGFIQEEVEKNLIEDKRGAMNMKYNSCIAEVEKHISILDPDFEAVAKVADDYEYLAYNNSLQILDLRKYLDDKFNDWAIGEIVRLVKQKKTSSAKMSDLNSGIAQVEYITEKFNVLDEHILRLACTLYEDKIATYEDIAKLPEYKGKDVYIRIIMIRIEDVLEKFDMSFDEIRKYIKPKEKTVKRKKK